MIMKFKTKEGVEESTKKVFEVIKSMQADYEELLTNKLDLCSLLVWLVLNKRVNVKDAVELIKQKPKGDEFDLINVLVRDGLIDKLEGEVLFKEMLRWLIQRKYVDLKEALNLINKTKNLSKFKLFRWLATERFVDEKGEALIEQSLYRSAIKK